MPRSSQLPLSTLDPLLGALLSTVTYYNSGPVNSVISSPVVYAASDVIFNTACLFIGQGCPCCNNISRAAARGQATIKLEPFHS